MADPQWQNSEVNAPTAVHFLPLSGPQLAATVAAFTEFVTPDVLQRHLKTQMI